MKLTFLKQYLQVGPLVAFGVLLLATIVYRQWEWSGVLGNLDSIVIAISQLYHGAAGMSGYHAIRDILLQQGQYLQPGQFDSLLREAIALPLSGTPDLLLHNGNSTAYIYFLMLAFKMLGPYSRSLYILFMLILFLSVVLLIVAHRRRPEIMAFASLALLAVACQLELTIVGHTVPMGNIYSVRCFTILAIIPAIHILACLFPASPLKLADWAGLSLQVILLAYVVSVRGTGYYLYFALLAVGVVSLIIPALRAPRREYTKLLLCIVSCHLFLNFAFATQLNPEYFIRGFGVNIFWHRVFISQGLHPDWPFQQYECVDYSEKGLSPGLADSNGCCIWFSYAVGAGLPTRYCQDNYLNRENESVIRKTFIDIAKKYPKKVFECFTIYKWKYLFSWYPGFTNKYINWYLVGVTAVAALLTLLSIAFASSVPGDRLAMISLFTAFMYFFSFLFPFLAWAAPHTSADLVINLFLSVGVALLLCTTWISSRFRRHLLKLNSLEKIDA